MVKQIAKEHLDEIPRIKKSVSKAYSFWASNRDRYRENIRFLYDSTFDPEDEQILSNQGKPAIRANTIETYCARWCGEFSKQIPEMMVRSIFNPEKVASQEDLIEGIIRYILTGSNYEHLSNHVMKDMCCGYGIMKVITDYKNNNTFQENIIIQRGFDPMLIIFDPDAREAHKGDGNFCAELIPKTKEELKEEYPDLDLENIRYSNDQLDINWRKKIGKDDVYFVCDYYEKEFTFEKIYLVSNPSNPNDPQTMKKDEYESLISNWTFSWQPPQILKQRKIKKTKIKRYKFLHDQLLDRPEETIYDELPFIFFDGNSYSDRGEQRIRSFFYNAVGIQKVKNFALSVLIGQAQMLRGADILMPEESIPSKDHFREAYNDIASNKAAFVWKSRNDAGDPLEKPEYFTRGQLDGMLFQIYNDADRSIQNILGTFNPEVGSNKYDLSGDAIEEGRYQANDAMRYLLMNFLESLNQVAKIILHLIPYCFKTMTTMPIITRDGKESYQMINDGNPNNSLEFDPNDLEVIIRAGANFEVQKDKALKTMVGLLPALPSLAQLINEKGLPELMKNLNIKGQDQWIRMSEEFLQQQQEMKMQAMQNPQPNPDLIKAQAAQAEAMVKAHRLELDQKKMEMDYEVAHMSEQSKYIKLLNDLQNDRTQLTIQMMNAQNEADRTAVEEEMKHIDAFIKIVDTHTNMRNTTNSKNNEENIHEGSPING